MTMGPALRDIHQPPAPPLWPPAPGWWALLALLLAVAVGAWAWRAARRRKRRRIEAVFDTAVAHAQTPAQAVAAMSESLRRAARLHDPVADRLQGEAWLALLAARLPAAEADALAPGTEPARLLLEGGFRGDVRTEERDALLPVARRAYLALADSGSRR